MMRLNIAPAPWPGAPVVVLSAGLGYPALYCAACGSYPPLFNEREFRP
ncbi:hypothetical protein OPU76_02765, partial [Klebsiella pneumoniae]|nr:hypothetical protein [Klebsiella pneumoniae]